ncbi:hypothetical protein AVEN_272765-1 [Araneus ventricosus]|uniref:Uncharacterized protein n=1 Tax=Araneus ventricosus TaxID=182803 RepID=A0A4Y2QZI7_ARAVE|nr:hypothetical protein AVEN_139178-1 [Araneus ventricosus]GBN68539.1 hypothetical protein AVEN_207945-1 [Araneus ventricosus]GBN69153.1 hypothetical protein AVEN_232830-1 [Araneus ventricosus]GBN69180.1 hypothetical protein AVEN_272765-1 [Araneus ventricosus]
MLQIQEKWSKKGALKVGRYTENVSHGISVLDRTLSVHSLHSPFQKRFYRTGNGASSQVLRGYRGCFSESSGSNLCESVPWTPTWLLADLITDTAESSSLDCNEGSSPVSKIPSNWRNAACLRAYVRNLCDVNLRCYINSYPGRS